MYAVIKTGGKQYKVAKDDVIVVEKLAGEAGGTVEFTDVLMVGGEGTATLIGSPTVAGAKVVAKVLEQPKDDKVAHAFPPRPREPRRIDARVSVGPS